jgi:hypothetical protein
MDEEKRIQKRLTDMGACAYLLMHGYKCRYDRGTKEFVFNVLDTEEQDFEDKQDDYLDSEFHRFDSCLMSLKKRMWKTYEN